MSHVTVDAETVALIGHGRVLPAPPGTGPWAMLDGHGDVLAVYEAFRDGQAKPSVVVGSAD
jgi:hypothetical protein